MSFPYLHKVINYISTIYLTKWLNESSRLCKIASAPHLPPVVFWLDADPACAYSYFCNIFRQINSGSDGIRIIWSMDQNLFRSPAAFLPSSCSALIGQPLSLVLKKILFILHFHWRTTTLVLCAAVHTSSLSSLRAHKFKRQGVNGPDLGFWFLFVGNRPWSVLCKTGPPSVGQQQSESHCPLFKLPLGAKSIV